MMVGGGEQREVIQAPALAEINRRMLKDLRYPWQWEQPFYVERELWGRANSEMDQVMRDRGSYSIELTSAPMPNFLYRGVPIVMAD